MRPRSCDSEARGRWRAFKPCLEGDSWCQCWVSEQTYKVRRQGHEVYWPCQIKADRDITERENSFINTTSWDEKLSIYLSMISTTNSSQFIVTKKEVLSNNFAIKAKTWTTRTSGFPYKEVDGRWGSWKQFVLSGSKACTTPIHRFRCLIT